MSKAVNISNFGDLNTIIADSSRTNVGIGSTIPTSKLDVVGNIKVSGISTVGSLNVSNNSVISGISTVGILSVTTSAVVGGGLTVNQNLDLRSATETVSVASTYTLDANRVILECDASNGTIFTHNLTNGVVGITSLKNFPVNKNSATTFTIIMTQNSAGTANTTPSTGIGTNIFLSPIGVTGFTTTSRVSSASTVTISSTPNDIDIVTFLVHYNGQGTSTRSNYQVYVTDNGNFRYGTIGF